MLWESIEAGVQFSVSCTENHQSAKAKALKKLRNFGQAFRTCMRKLHQYQLGNASKPGVLWSAGADVLMVSEFDKPSLTLWLDERACQAALFFA